MSTVTVELLAALRAHYGDLPGHRDEDAHATFTELTAPGSDRRVDLLSVSLWPSRGLTIDAHEIKVSRSDWVRELQQPSKAQAWWPHCHRWWLVAADASIVVDGELPDGWGLMVPGRGRRMRVISAAARRQITVTMPLLAMLLSRGRRQATAAVRNARAEGFRKGETAQQELSGRRELTSEQRRRLDEVERLELLLGGPVGDWLEGRDAHSIATALRLAGQLRDLPMRWPLDQAQKAADDAATAVREMRGLLAEIQREVA